MARKQASIATDEDYEKTVTADTIKAKAATGYAGQVTAAPNLLVLLNIKGARGAHRWIYRWTPKGEKRPAEIRLGKLTIEGGKLSGLTLSDARTAARELRTLIENGGDPRKERRDEKQAAADEAEDARRVENGEPARDSFRQYGKEYVAKRSTGEINDDGTDADRAKPSKLAKWSDSYRDGFEQSLEANVYPYIGNMNVKTITTEDGYNLLARIEARGSLAMMHRVKAQVFNILEMVRKRRLIPENPIAFLDEDTLAEHIEQNRPAVSTARELRDVLLKFDAYNNRPITQGIRPSSQATYRAMMLQVYLFQRPHMIAEIKKEWIDWTGERAGTDIENPGVVIYFPFAEMKLKAKERAKRTGFHEVPVPPQAEKFLREQFDASDDPVYLFPGAKNGKHPHMLGDTINDGMQRALGKQSNRDWIVTQCAHGFRAVALTLGADYVGLNKDVINSIQAHVGGDKVLKKAYDRSTYVHLRQDAMTRFASWIDDVRAGKKHALTLPKSALSETTQVRIDADKFREMERSGELAEFRAYQAAKAGAGVAAINSPIIRTAEDLAANNTPANAA